MNWLTDPQIWIAFFTLFALELVLGIDNIIFISILSGKLPALNRTARLLGLGWLCCRGFSSLFLSWLIRLTAADLYCV